MQASPPRRLIQPDVCFYTEADHRLGRVKGPTPVPCLQSRNKKENSSPSLHNDDEQSEVAWSFQTLCKKGCEKREEGMTCVSCSDNVSSLGTNLLCSRHPSTTKRKNQGIPSLTRMKSKVRLQGASRHFARRDMKRGKEGVTCVFLSTTKDHPDPSQI